MRCVFMREIGRLLARQAAPQEDVSWSLGEASSNLAEHVMNLNRAGRVEIGAWYWLEI